MSANQLESGTPIGVALIGCGFAGDFHAENWRRVLGVGARLVGAHSPRRERTQAFVEKQGVRNASDDLEHLFGGPDVDLVDSCVPNRFHEEMVVRAEKLHICREGFGPEGRYYLVSLQWVRFLLVYLKP